MGSSPPVPPHYEQTPAYHTQSTAPEYLPPNQGYIPQPPPPARKPRPMWKAAPATHILIAINCIVFLWMTLHGVSPMRPTTGQLLYFGADHAGLVLLVGEWYRVVTAMFVHVGIIHLATNMWCLWNLGLLAEPLVGTWGLLALYLLTGAAGNMLSVLRNWLVYNHEWAQFHDLGVFPAGAGASGAVFGISGALILLLRSKQLPITPEELRKLRRSVLYFAGINLVIGFSISMGASAMRSGMNIDNMAHLGGFCCGLIFALPMVPRLGVPRPVFNRRLQLAVLMVVFLLVLFGFYCAQLTG